MQPFCVECGLEGVDLIEGVCPECRVRTRPPARFPVRVVVERCAHCGSRRRGSAWEDFAGTPADAIADDARRQVELSPGLSRARVAAEARAEDAHNYHVLLALEGEMAGVPLRQQGTARGHLKIATCPRCSRIFGGYYEAIVQLRSEGKLRPEQVSRAGAIVDRVLTRMQERGNRDAFLMKAKEERGGVDYYLGTTESARVIARGLQEELGARTSQSESLVGRRDGRDLYRVTFLARVPEYEPGGFVGVDGAIHRVHAIGPKLVTLVAVASGRKVSQGREALTDALVFGSETIRDAVVVSESGDELQILDPETLRTVDVPKPAGLEPGKQVRVLRWNDQLHVVG